jgi:hypothetical protein
VDDSRVHIFLDNSNIFVGARNACDEREDALRRNEVRLNFESLLKLAADGRDIEQAVAIGSIPPSMRAVWDRLEGAGVKVELQERGAFSNTEQGVDEALRLKMMHALTDYDPAVCVLLSGDGDFFPEVSRMLSKGWGVEVLSFESDLSRRLRAIGIGYGGRGRYVLLDDWYEQIVYLKGGAVIPQRGCVALDTGARPRV